MRNRIKGYSIRKVEAHWSREKGPANWKTGPGRNECSAASTWAENHVLSFSIILECLCVSTSEAGRGTRAELLYSGLFIGQLLSVGYFSFYEGGI